MFPVRIAGNTFHLLYGDGPPPEIVGPKSPCLIRSTWLAELYGQDGLLKNFRSGKVNVVVAGGTEKLAQYLNDAASSAQANTFKYIACGTDSTAEASSNTVLGTETKRLTGTVSYISGSIYQVVVTFATNSATGEISEYGLFNSSTGGTMFSRDKENTMSVGSNDTLKVTNQITFT